MSDAATFLWLIGALLATAVLAVVANRRPQLATGLVYGATASVSLLGLAAAASALAGGDAAASTVRLPLGLPWTGAHFRVDALAAFFLVVVNLGGLVTSLFGLGNGRHEHEPHRVLPFFPAFLAAMTLVVVADDAFTFLASWEFMSLTSWALVRAHHRDPDNARAGYVYLLMAGLGTLSLLLAFGLVAGATGEFGFAAIRAAPRGAEISALAFVLVLIGTGSKAGLVPLHAWLPLAHPAAPSHVSALMSGVMTKVAVYGFIRLAFDLLGMPAWWSGLLLLVVGGGSAVLGILSALMETDLKRILANSTVENIGVVFAGLGLALAFRADAMPGAAALALTAALFHAFNHSLFKSLLFLGSGAVLTATGERDIGKLGGLIHRMPATAVAVLAGCVAIAALPPFNGFASEWLTFQAILQKSGAVPVGPQDIRARRGRPAGAVGGARRGMLRAGLRNSLSRPSPVDRKCRGEGSRACVARADAPARGALLPRRHPSRGRHGRPRPCRKGLDGRRDARPVGAALDVYRTRRLGPELVQRPARLPVHRDKRAPRRLPRPPGRIAGDPPGASLGLRLSGPGPVGAVFGDGLLAAPAPHFRHARLPGARPGRHAAAGRRTTGAPDGGDARSRLGPDLHARSRPDGSCRKAARPSAVPHDPQVSRPRLRRARPPAPGARAMDMIAGLLVQGAQMALVLCLAPLLTGLVRKVKARLTRRRGPPLVQPYRDLARLLRKETVIADNASWLFLAAPYLIFAATWVAAALVPTFAAGLQFSWTADLIAIVALLGSARFFLALAGMDVGTAFGAIGASREMMLASFAEPALLLTIFTLALVSGSTQLSAVAAALAGPEAGLRVSLGLALVALVVVALAENARIPVDNPSTHLELTMVHEAMVLEYSGRHLAMIELAAALKLLLYLSLVICIFMPWGLASEGAGAAALLTGLASYLAKLAAGGVLLGVFETAIAKMRVFRVPDFIGTALMLSLLGTLLLFMSRSL